MFRTDFHIHSTFSDGKLNIPEIVDLYGRLGFGAIAITDHLCEETGVAGRAAHYFERTLTRTTFPLYRSLLQSESRRAMKEYGMLLIPGLEITKNSLINHRSAHILALGVTDWISADQTPEQIAAEVRSQNGLSVVAHPLTPDGSVHRPLHLWSRREVLEKHFDAWETTFHHLLLKDVLESPLARLATSDFHHIKHMASYKTLFNCRRSQAEIFEAVRHKDIEILFYNGEETLDCLRDIRGVGCRVWGGALGNPASA